MPLGAKASADGADVWGCHPAEATATSRSKAYNLGVKVSPFNRALRQRPEPS